MYGAVGAWSHIFSGWGDDAPFLTGTYFRNYFRYVFFYLCGEPPVGGMESATFEEKTLI